jgi:S-adenosylmethionine:tRNA ribosyltransferase-isomerase
LEKVNTDLFDYPLPERLIAQRPSDRRDDSRLLVVDRKTRSLSHRRFRDLPEYLRPTDTLFRNNAAVIPARLHATRPTGGQVECLLLRPAAAPRNRDEWLASSADAPRAASTPERDNSTTSGLNPPASDLPPPVADEWWCLLRPGKKLPVGATFSAGDLFTGIVREKTDDGLARVAFRTTERDILAVANRIGDMPLPPYISSHDAEPERALDRERYQTVYAQRDRQVAAAAPTAGLHFTPELLCRIAGEGVVMADLTLHVGLGTFRPITSSNIEDHPIHREVYEIPATTQQALFGTRGRRIAVGTTSVRSIEDFLSRHETPLHRDFIGEAGIFIYPPRSFLGVDALITNFHQPRSTLLCLVSAFLSPGGADGIQWLKEIYADAIASEYRFFSYGDAMLIL